MTDAPTLSVLITTAISIAAVHTFIGVDHSLPFVVIGKARGWSLRRTLGITALCGLGHVLSSVLLGFVGIGLGVALEKLELIEGTRGGWAAWLLIAFGTFYAARAFIRSRRGHTHSHRHMHADGVEHEHPHDHQHAEHMHPHGARAEHGAHAHDSAHAQGSTAGAAGLTVWTLFIIFVFGPCEPLIPLLMAPAALLDWASVALVAGIFGAVTIGTMLAVVAVAYVGLGQVRMAFAQRHADTLAGLAIACSGLAIQVLGI